MKVTLAIVPFNGEAHQPIHPGHSVGKAEQSEDLVEDCVPEIQNSDQSSSQSLNVSAILATHDGWGMG